MHDFCLIRHGESVHRNLTSVGLIQVTEVTERWRRLGVRGGVVVFHSPIECAKETAEIFCKLTGRVSEVCYEISPANYHNFELHHEFAERIAKMNARHVVLIGHEETRRVCGAISWQSFRRTDKPPYLPFGKILRFNPSHGYEVV